MTSFDTGKKRRSSGLRAWRLKFKGASAERIVVFDSSEQGSELGRVRVRLWKVYDRAFGWFDRHVRERLESLSPEMRTRSIQEYVHWMNTQQRGIEGSVPVHCYECQAEWVKGTERRCSKCRWEHCPTCGACGCGYISGFGY